MDPEVPSNNSSISVQTVHGLVLLVHSVRPMGDADWGAFMAHLWAVGRATGRVRALVFTPGPAPNANQRLKLSELCKDYRTRIAVCTESRIARAVIVAIDWASGIDISSYKVSEVDDACDYLEVEPEHHAEVVALFQKMRREMS